MIKPWNRSKIPNSQQGSYKPGGITLYLPVDLDTAVRHDADLKGQTLTTWFVRACRTALATSAPELERKQPSNDTGPAAPPVA